MFKRFKTILFSIYHKLKWLVFGSERSQLELILPKSKINKNIEYKLDEEYSVIKYNKKYNNELCLLYTKSGFDFDSVTKLNEALFLCVPNGFKLILHNKSNRIVAAFMARQLSDKNYFFGGRLDWLAVHKSHRGNKLGYIVTVLCVNRLIEIGYKNIYVTTDEHRLPAIKTFLNVGFVPNYYSNQIKTKWESVFFKLNNNSI